MTTPTNSPEPIKEWLRQLEVDWDFSLPTEAFEELVEALASQPIKPAEPSITERELSFALNYHSDDTRINDADWKIARRYFEAVERYRGVHPSLIGAEP